MKKNLTHFAKALRHSSTDAEHLLWHHLRAHRLQGHKFRRQHQLGPYIVDFVCLDAQLVIELDGGQHLESAADERRDAWLREQGFRVLRVWNNELLGNMEGVLEKVLEMASLPPSPQPSPLEGEGA